MLTITLLLVLIGNVLFSLDLLKKLDTSYRFIEKISDGLVPIVNKDLPPTTASRLRNDIKLFLLMNRYTGKGKAKFKARNARFVKKYKL